MLKDRPSQVRCRTIPSSCVPTSPQTMYICMPYYQHAPATSAVRNCSLSLRDTSRKDLNFLTLVGRQRCCGNWITRLSSLRGDIWSSAHPSARMCLLTLPLVQPHAPPRLHQRSLSRRVRGLQAMLEGCVLRVCKPVGSVTLQGREFPNHT